MFLYHGGKSSGSSGNFIYQPSGASDNTIRRAGEYGNHMYLHVNRGYRDVDWDGAFDKMEDQDNWSELARVCKTAYDNGVMLSLVSWSYKWSFTDQDWGGSDLLRDMNSLVSRGRSKWDLIKLSADKVVEACWEFPNVTFNMMWEYNVRINRSDDRDGAIYRAWVDYMNEQGRKVDPSISHLYSIEYGGEHPSVRNADFITEEDGNGFWKATNDAGGSESLVKSYNVPLVFWASDWDYECSGCAGTAIGPAEYREQVRNGFNPASAFAPPTDDALEHTLQLRWYMENNGFATSGLPNYRSPSRPNLSNPSGYNNGVRRNGNTYDFAVNYSGSSPVLAQVWADVNGDGRFAKNERFDMQVSGSTHTRSGVIASASGLRYVFRFANSDWYPPVPGEGLAPPTWYGHFVLGQVSPPSPIPTPTPTSASPSPPSDGWIFCVNEHGFCSFSGTKEVRYGANGFYRYLVLSNGTDCTNAVFGDPIKGVFKQCHYRDVTTISPSPIPKQGDLDKDGDVDIFDYNLLVANFGSTNCGSQADINGDCKVDIFDYNLLVTNFGK